MQGRHLLFLYSRLPGGPVGKTWLSRQPGSQWPSLLGSVLGVLEHSREGVGLDHSDRHALKLCTSRAAFRLLPGVAGRGLWGCADSARCNRRISSCRAESAAHPHSARHLMAPASTISGRSVPFRCLCTQSTPRTDRCVACARMGRDLFDACRCQALSTDGSALPSTSRMPLPTSRLFHGTRHEE